MGSYDRKLSSGPMSCYEKHLRGNPCRQVFNVCASCPNKKDKPRTPRPPKPPRRKKSSAGKVSGSLAVGFLGFMFILANTNDNDPAQPDTTERPYSSSPIEDIVIPAWRSFSAPWFAREYTMTNGERFYGTLDSENRAKKGTYQYHSGNKYEGAFLSGRPHGRGNMYYSDGSKYSGQWQNGIKHGIGTYHSPQGVIYSGEFSNGTIVEGKMIQKDGSYYVGSFQNNLRHGEGTFIKTFTTADNLEIKATYSGEWKQDALPYGKVIYDHPTYNYYVGEFDVNLIPSGEGSAYDIDTDDLEANGTFVHGQLTGPGTLYLADGATLTGNFEDFLIQGIGEKKYANGATYVGEFENNDVSGKGTYTTSHGEEFTGTFYTEENGEIHMDYTGLWNYLDWRFSRD